MSVRTGLIAGCLALAACAAPEPVKKEAPQAEAPKQEAPKQEAPKQEAAKQDAAPTFVAAPEGDVAEIVRKEAAGPGTLVVYVGAVWCEPCRAFHEAVQEGRFDRQLAGARFLEFDLDRDKDRLVAAGYTSRYIPLFALPGPDGRAGGQQIEGGIKGPQAAEHVLGRLVPLISGATTP